MISLRFGFNAVTRTHAGTILNLIVPVESGLFWSLTQVFKITEVTLCRVDRHRSLTGQEMDIEKLFVAFWLQSFHQLIAIFQT